MVAQPALVAVLHDPRDVHIRIVDIEPKYLRHWLRSLAITQTTAIFLLALNARNVSAGKSGMSRGT